MNQKIPTGSAGLDEILCGGIPINTITVVMGAPGTGKTILAEQLAFFNATPESPALYLTTLSEPLEKFVANGQKYEFFDPARIGVSVFYEDLGLMLREKGVQKLPEVMTSLLLERRPKYVIIDSFKALNELLSGAQERRTVIYDLATVLSSYSCTSFLVGEYAAEMMTELPEFAIADVILQLVKHSTNVREQRFIRVEKLRGSDSISGMHAFQITAQGMKVFPRLLTPTAPPDHSRQKLERVTTGIGGLDELIQEGFWRGSTTLIAGPSGVGKTIMGLHFVAAGASKGETGVYVGLQENPTQLFRIMRGLGWDPEQLSRDGGFQIMYHSPVELQLESLTTALFQLVRTGKVKRVVIDALGDLERATIDRQRFSDFIYSLSQWFAVEGVTCLLLFETRELFDVDRISDQQVSNMSDNVLLLRFLKGKEIKRTIRIIKTRGSAHNNREHELVITSNGVAVKDLD
jgi:circadian clock protein KaiC